MISIHKREVPEYLRSSPLFQSAFYCEDSSDLDSDELFVDFPADCLHPNVVVRNESDLHALLRTLRFWLIPDYIETCFEFFDYVLSKRENLAHVLSEFSQDIPFLIKLHAALRPEKRLTLLDKAAKFGILGLVKFLRARGAKWNGKDSRKFTAIAAEFGQLDCLRYAVENGCELQREACYFAAKNGHIDCLKFAHEHGADILFADYEKAVRNGHLECVKYIVESRALNFHFCKDVCDIAIRRHDIDMLIYLTENLCRPIPIHAVSAAVAFDDIECLSILHRAGCFLSMDTMYVAVHCGSLTCVKYLHEAGCLWDVSTLQNGLNYLVLSARGRPREMFPEDAVLATFRYAVGNGCPVSAESSIWAAEIGSIEMLQQIQSLGVPFHSTALTVAAMDGHLHCLQYLLDHDCPASPSAYLSAIRHNRFESIKLLHAHGTTWESSVATASVRAARNPDILRYFLENGCPASADLFLVATTNNSLGCLQCLHEHGLQLTEEVVATACRAGASLCLEYALNNGCFGSENDCILAVTHGYLDCLKILHKHGVLMSETVYAAALLKCSFECVAYVVIHGLKEKGPEACAKAASFRTFKHLKCLRESGVDWDINTCLTAVRKGSFECLKYAIKNGCTQDVEVPAAAARQGNREMLKWLHRKRYPWDGRTTAAALREDQLECLQYAVRHHCPCEIVVQSTTAETTTIEAAAAAAVEVGAVAEVSPRCWEYMQKRGNNLVRRALRNEETRKRNKTLQGGDVA